ncbi:conserved hypothetical protein [Desulfovibrionales bacterium]
MMFDYNIFFAKYEALLAEADGVFGKVAKQCPGQVNCKVGCSDCCYAMFDLSFIEALYLNYHFYRTIQGERRVRIMDRADAADRKAYRFKRKIFKDSEAGRSTAEILSEVAAVRLRCPLLDEEGRCELYVYRPVNCRLYGVPMAISGKAHTCGLSGFIPGISYPTVNVELLQNRLVVISQEDLVASLNTCNYMMGNMFVPVSMALLTTYDKEYLGIYESKGCLGRGSLTLDGEISDEVAALGGADVIFWAG